MRTVRALDQHWQPLAQGVRTCILNDQHGVRSALVEFSPGSALPGHRHLAHEECMVLRGSLTTGDIHVGPHDYHLAKRGSKHPRITSAEGALIFLRGTSIGSGPRMLRELLTAWLPGRGDAPETIHASAAAWQTSGEGVRLKRLWHNGESESLLVSLAPGGQLSLAATPASAPRELLTLSGEVFGGDVLLGPGEYQIAPGSAPMALTSDVGGLLFMHVPADSARP